MGNNFTSALGTGGGIAPTGDALVTDVLAGKTFSNADGIGKTGTMVNNGAVTETLTYDEVYTIPEGYHNGNGTVTAPSTSEVTFTKLTASGATNPITTEVGHEYVWIGVFNGTPGTVNVTGGVLRDAGQVWDISSSSKAYVVAFKATSTSVTITGSFSGLGGYFLYDYYA